MKTNFKKLPNSTRKFIRSEKGRIRRQLLDQKQQEEAIANMYNKILGQPVVKSGTSESVKVEKALPQKKEKQITKKSKPKTKISKKGKNKK